MAKTKISEWSSTSADNTDISNINIAEGCSPANVNNAIRTVMAQVKDLQAGLSGDTIPVASGGTGSTTATDARTALSAAKSGANSDITSITGLTTALSVAQGGTGSTSTTYCNLASNVTGTLPAANGGTGLTSFTAGTNYVAPATATTFTAQQTFSGSSSVLAAKFANSAEVVTVSASGATGTINYDLTTQSILYYTGNSSGVLTLNFRASSGTSLNTAMAVGDSVTGTLMITNSTATTVTAGSFVVGQTYTIVSVGTTSFTAIGASSNTVGLQFTATGVGSGTGTASYSPYVLTVQVDGTTITPKYQNGNVINTGDASAIDAFTYTIIKTASATFTVLASKTKFA